jgi:hypothetical protein
MASHDRPAVRDGGPLNGFLRRWRRNASRAGALTAALAAVAVAVAAFVLCACKSLLR